MNTMIAIDAEALDKVLRKLDKLEALIASARIQPERQWLTVSQYADHIGKTVRTVNRRIEKGLLEVKTEGGERLIRASV